MSTTSISVNLRRQVIDRANGCCEYCLIPDGLSFYPHEVDHVIAEKHGGATHIDNLALACWRCNRHKGTDLTSIDPQTGVITPLFNPRTQHWMDHFHLREATIEPLTSEGRVTVHLLQLNHPDRVEERRVLTNKGHYPPSHVTVSQARSK